MLLLVPWGPADLSPAAELGDLPRRLALYARGRPVAFDDPLDLAEASPFQRAVWLAARQIPHGQTQSYGWLAQAVGRPGAARALGQALARNPLPIIVPCHRVIGADGSLGGYCGGQVAIKAALLGLEGAQTWKQSARGSASPACRRAGHHERTPEPLALSPKATRPWREPVEGRAAHFQHPARTSGGGARARLCPRTRRCQLSLARGPGGGFGA